MFIAHGEWLRKYAPWILAGVLLLLLPGFVLLFSPTASVKAQRSQLPTIGGKPVNFAEFQNARNAVMTDIILSKGRQPPHTAQLDDDLNMAATQRLVLMRKAKKVGTCCALSGPKAAPTESTERSEQNCRQRRNLPLHSCLVRGITLVEPERQAGTARCP